MRLRLSRAAALAGSSIIVTILALSSPVRAQPPTGPAGSGVPGLAPDPGREKRLAWFREAKVGLFIHWGLYALPAGRWKGVDYPFIGEWIMRWAKIPRTEYEGLATRFNPTRFDAEEVARLAKEAGMKYVVITAKHHDGFAMFDSRASRFDIVDATPYKRDPLKALAAACKKEGLPFGFYYSQAQDWHEANAAGNTWDFPTPHEKRDPGEYLARKALPQVRELLTGYGPLGLIWFDTPQLLTRQNVTDLEALVRTNQPDCLINSRLGHGLGDYAQMGDNMVPSDVYPSDWEIPATLNDTWGFKTQDGHWKSPGYLIYRLVDVVSKGGNYLLNVGPDATGVIPVVSAQRLREIGRWLARHGEAIHGTTASPFSVGSDAFRATVKPGLLYLHLLRWPAGGRFELRGLETPVKRAYLLSDPARESLKVESSKGAVVITLPGDAPDPYVSVLALELDGAAKPVVTPSLRWDAPRDVVILHARDASPHGPLVRYSEFDQTVSGFAGPGDSMKWHLLSKRAGTYGVELEYAAPGTGPGDELVVKVLGQQVGKRLTATGPGDDYRWLSLGTFSVKAPGLEMLDLRFKAPSRSAAVRVRALRITARKRP